MSAYTDLLSYYSNLLIAQFNGKPNAKATIELLVSGILGGDGTGSTLPLDVLGGFNLNATVQTLVFSAVPASGTFSLGYGLSTTAALPYNASASQLQAAFQTLLGPSAASVAGTPSSQSVRVSFQTIVAPQRLFVSASTLLDAGSAPVSIALSSNVAVGKQLDWLGTIVGVARSGVGANGQSITLSDADFLLFIRIAIASNNFGSSLSTIQGFLSQFFPNSVLVFDYANTAPMQMSFLIATDSASSDLIQLVLAQHRLPVPMAVQYSVIGAPDITNFFGLSDYYVNAGAQPANTTPLNNIASYTLPSTNTSYRWMDYSYSLKNS